MSDERQAAMVNASVARAMIRSYGMNAENARRAMHGESMAYTEDDFVSLIEDEGIGYNQVIQTLNEGR